MTKTIWTMTIATILVAGLVAPAFTNNAFAASAYTVDSDELGGKVTVNPIPLGTDVSSFYSYNSPDGASANTNFEQSDTTVLFLGEDDNGDVSLFVIYDEAGDGTGGRVLTSITSNGLDGEGVGFLVKDDPGELASWNDGDGTGSTNHRWVGCCTDGFVLGTLPTTDFDIFPGFNVINGISSFEFLTQGETGLETIVVSSDSTPDGLVISLTANQIPDCSAASPSQALLWPPNHKYVPITIDGITDDDEVTVTIDGIEQDEEVDVKGKGDGNTSPDGVIDGDTAEVRAERAGNGDGRVYEISFTADDGNGGSCSSSVIVGVPHDKKDTPVDSIDRYDSTVE